jgi:eukaryotic-like serine/threonine-protein kinase
VTAFVLLIVFVFAVAIIYLARASTAILAGFVGGAGTLFALALWVLNLDPSYAGGTAQPERAVSALVISGIILVASLVPLEVYTVRKRRTAKRKASPTRAPTLAGVGSKSGKSDSVGLTRYEVLERVGIGGMATVFRAKRKDDQRTVALKIPQDKFVADARFVRRFHREAEVLMRLNHPNIVKVFEHSNEGTTHYIAMELIEGESLENLIETRRLTIEHGVQVMMLTADALRYIHKQGIIHRDIKPGNIMVSKNGLRADNTTGLEPGSVKLMDFGIAAGKVLTRLTMTGARVGTPVYMSPEQARGNKIDHRTDIYSLGLVFYEIVTGQTAFKGGYEAVVQAQIFQTPTPPRQLNLEVPQRINDLIMRMVEKDPDKRPTLTEVIEMLEDGALHQETKLEGPGHLVLSLNTRKGPVRILSLSGNLEHSFGQVGIGSDKLPVAPVAIAVDAEFNIYASVFEYRSGEAATNIIRKFTPEGQPLLTFGRYGMNPGEFLYPVAIAASSWGQLYILDGESHTVQRYSMDGEYLGKFGGRGTGLGQFDDPRAIVAGADGRVYVLDYGNRRVQRFGPDGEFIQRYSFKLRPDNSELRLLDGIAVDGNGVTYISDANSSKIRTLIPPKGTQGPTFAIEALTGEDTSQVMDIAIDGQGYLYAVRRGGHIVRKFRPDGTFMNNIETYNPVQNFALFVRDHTKT